MESIPRTYPNGRKVVLPQLTEEKKRIFFAASADVFGAMGSWNDSPSWAAYEKGLEYEYNLLSEELLRQLKLAALYAVNENRAGGRISLNGRQRTNRAGKGR